MIRILVVFLCCIQLFYYVAPLEVPQGRGAPPTPEDLSRFAVEHKNAEQLFNEFTHNWNLERDDVVIDRARILTSLSRSPYYNEMDDSTALKTGTSRSTLTQLINLFGISQPFKTMLQTALTEGCPYFIDEEFHLEGKTLIYFRAGFMQQSVGQDKYMLFQALYSVDFTNLLPHTQTFLECAAKFRTNDTLCAMPINLSKLDWLIFKIWFKANAITSFMGNYKAKHDQVMNQLRELVQYLPPTYKPLEKCPLWQPNPMGCDTVTSPKLGIVLGLAENANYTKPSFADIIKVKGYLKGDVQLRAEPSLNCRISTSLEAQAIFADWVAKGYINQYFSGDLANTLSMRTDGGYFVRDLIFKSEESARMVNYARVFVHIDNQANDSYNIGAIFVKMQVTYIVRTQAPAPCDPKVQFCLVDQARFAREDQLLRNYLFYKAANFLTEPAVPMTRVLDPSIQLQVTQGNIDEDQDTDLPE